jgi:hypothetical protein
MDTITRAPWRHPPDPLGIRRSPGRNRLLWIQDPVGTTCLLAGSTPRRSVQFSIRIRRLRADRIFPARPRLGERVGARQRSDPPAHRHRPTNRILRLYIDKLILLWYKPRAWSSALNASVILNLRGTLMADLTLIKQQKQRNRTSQPHRVTVALGQRTNATNSRNPPDLGLKDQVRGID